MANGGFRLGPWGWFVLFVALTGGLIIWVASETGTTPRGDAEWARILRGIGFAALVGAGLIHGRRIGLTHAVGAAFFWVALGAALVLGYSYRFELSRAWDRLTGEINPSSVRVTSPGTLTVRQSEDGHFYVVAQVNGATVRFLVDTGASTTVLDPDDARRAGFDPVALSYTRIYRTANGTVSGAPVRIANLKIGPVRLTGVRASVNRVALGTSLLGISTLDRFRGWRVEDGRLMLQF